MLTPELKRQLREVCPYDPEGRTWLVVVAERLIELAASGNPAAIKGLWERIDGKVHEDLQLDIRLQAIRNMTDAELEVMVTGARNSALEQSR